MTLPTITDEWSAPFLTTAPTIFQIRSGHAFLDIGGLAPDGSSDGFVLTSNPDESRYGEITIPTGVTVRWRRASPRPAVLFYATLA